MPLYFNKTPKQLVLTWFLVSSCVIHLKMWVYPYAVCLSMCHVFCVTILIPRSKSTALTSVTTAFALYLYLLISYEMRALQGRAYKHFKISLTGPSHHYDTITCEKIPLYLLLGRKYRSNTELCYAKQ